MSGRIVILRPEPGAGQTAARARAMGLEPVVRTLFDVRALPWDLPDPRRYDAIFFTSANALRLAGGGLVRLTGLPAYAVGEATAAAARAGGFGTVRTGPSDGDALLALARSDGVARALHLCGRDNIPLRHPDMTVDPCVVYVSEARGGAIDLPADAVVLLHSPRAAAAFAGRVGERRAVRVAALSPAVAQAAGEGWAALVVAAAPRDDALLEVARALCQSEAPDAAGAGS